MAAQVGRTPPGRGMPYVEGNFCAVRPRRSASAGRACIGCWRRINRHLGVNLV
jgi:hypothetical protein